MTRPPTILAMSSLAVTLATVGTQPAQAQSGVATTAQGESAQPLFAVVYRPGPKWKVGAPMKDQDLRNHFLYLRDLGQKGAVVVAGPLGDDGGLVILRASNQEAALRMVSADPAVLAGVFVGQVRPFLPRIGGSEPLLPAVPAGR
jgi:uncharacterized protein YciI